MCRLSACSDVCDLWGNENVFRILGFFVVVFLKYSNLFYDNLKPTGLSLRSVRTP